MKIRQGFVSNSSSSSYTCNVCGFSEYLWEAPEGFKYCVLGHGLCEECYEVSGSLIEELSKLPAEDALERLGYDIKYSYAQDLLERLKSCNNNQDIIYDLFYDLLTEGELSDELCPVCQLEVITDADMKRYLMKISGIKPETVFEHVKSQNKRRRKLYDHEYITYVCSKLAKDTIELAKEVTQKFEDYGSFKGFIK